MKLVTQERLQELLSYDINTGIFRWKVDRTCKTKCGDIAGYCGRYVTIRIDSKSYQAHRLAWLYVYGECPKYQIDHINGIKQDNRLVNLREATPSQNQMNRGTPSTNTSGHKGISWYKSTNKWRATISVDKKQISLGYYENIDDAIGSYQLAVIKYHNEYAHY